MEKKLAPEVPGSVFSYKLGYILGFGLVEMDISANPKPTIYRNLSENTGPRGHCSKIGFHQSGLEFRLNLCIFVIYACMQPPFDGH